jgi:hypothetical protein
MKTISTIFLSAILFACSPRFTELNDHGFGGGCGGSSKLTKNEKVDLVETKNQKQIVANLPVSEVQLIQTENNAIQECSTPMTAKKSESVTLLQTSNSKVHATSNFNSIPKIKDQKSTVKKTNALTTKAKIWIGSIIVILTILTLLIIAGFNAMGGASPH